MTNTWQKPHIDIRDRCWLSHQREQVLCVMVLCRFRLFIHKRENPHIQQKALHEILQTTMTNSLLRQEGREGDGTFKDLLASPTQWT